MDKIEIDDLNVSNLLVLEDGHCFRNHVLNLCQMNRIESNTFDLKSGSFETLINLSNEGLGMTLVPYLNTLTLSRENKAKLKHFQDPPPAREISLIFPKSQLKIQIIDALQKTIEGIIRGAIVIENVKIISP